MLVAGEVSWIDVLMCSNAGGFQNNVTPSFVTTMNVNFSISTSVAMFCFLSLAACFTM